MKTTGWDVVCSKEDPNSLWFAYQIARALNERRHAVRLITDEVRALSVAQRDVDPKLWVQAHDTGHIVDQRISGYISPVANLVQVFDSRPSRGYMSRFVSQETPGNWFCVRAPWHDGDAREAVRLLDSTSSYRRYEARLGDVPGGAGYVRPPAQGPVRRRGAPWLRQARASLLNLLCLPHTLLEHELFVLASGGDSCRADAWLQGRATLDLRSCLFVADGPMQAQLAPRVGLEPGTTGIADCGGVTVVFLPPLMWFVLDEVIGACDAVLTCRDDMALRAAENGTPVILAAPQARAAAFLHWYAPAASADLRQAWLAFADALQTGAAMDKAWIGFVGRHPQFNKAAADLQDRMNGAPELVDMLSAAAAGDGADHVARFFAPTQPIEMHE